MDAPSTPSAEPLVRARSCQDWLALIALEEEPYRTRFFERLTDGLRTQIEGASRVAWLPLVVHVKLADILLDAFGTVRAYDYYRRALASAVKGPLFGPLFRTGSRVLGLSPASFVRWGSRAYDVSFRHAGAVAGEVLGPGRACLRYLDLPPVCTASDAWMTSAQGFTYGVYDVLGVDGVVRLDTSARGEGKMVLELEWSDRKRGS